MALSELAPQLSGLEDRSPRARSVNGRLFALLAPLLTLLASCAPAAATDAAGPVVALINAPAEHRVTGVAGMLQDEVSQIEGCCDFSFTRTAPVRFQETHRDMFGSRAAPAAASLARNLGADIAVLAGAPLFERTVTEVTGGKQITGEVQLQAILIDAQSGTRLTTVGSIVVRGERFVADGQMIPEVEEDPTMLTLRDRALADMAPYLAAALADLAGNYD